MDEAGGPALEIVCVDVRDGQVLMVPVRQQRSLPPRAGGHAVLSVPTSTGVLVLRGTLDGPRPFQINRVPHQGYRLSVRPDGVDRMNQRAHYRVSVPLKGELVVLDPLLAPETLGRVRASQAQGGASHLERVAARLEAARRPCVLYNISLGGAQVSVTSPAPAPGQTVLLDLKFGPGEFLRGLTGEVLESRPDATATAFDARVRLRFLGLSARTESALSRQITRLQVEMLQKGVKV